MVKTSFTKTNVTVKLECGHVEAYLGALQTSMMGNIGKIVKELTTVIISKYVLIINDRDIMTNKQFWKTIKPLFSD